MEKARCNTELYSNLRGPLNNVKPSNFWGSHQTAALIFYSNELLLVSTLYDCVILVVTSLVLSTL